MNPIKPGDFITFESGGVRQVDCRVHSTEINLTQLWVYVDAPPGGFTSVCLRGVIRHCIPATRILDYRPGIELPLSRPRARTRTRPQA
jgi:hypothetical protein